MSGERVVTPKAGEEDQQIEKSLRPRRLAEFIGQEKVVEQLRIAIMAAKGRGEPLDHTLLYGPPVWERRVWQACLPPKWGSTSS